MLEDDKVCVKFQNLTDLFYKQYKGIPKGIIFDCDGVLIDSVEANMLFYNTLRQRLELPELNAEQREFCQMSTVAQSFNYIIPKNLISQIPVIMKDFSYAKEIEPLITISQNLLPFLNKFKDFCKMGVHTNRMSNIDPMLERLGMGNIFNPIITVERAEAKPSPDGTLQILTQWNIEAKDALFIGDSKADQQAAKAANVPFLSYRNPNIADEGICCNFSELTEAFDLILEK